jgi:hypothetical protein
MPAKPPCTLTDRDATFYILRRVVDALRAAGETNLVDKFLRYAALCQCRRQVAELAREFVDVEEPPPDLNAVVHRSVHERERQAEKENATATLDSSGVSGA